MGESNQKRKKVGKIKDLQESGAFYNGLFTAIIILLFGVINILPYKNGGMIGGAFFNASKIMILLMGVICPIGLANTVSSFMKKRISKDYYANAKKVLFAGFISVILFAAIFSIIAVVLTKLVGETIFLADKGILCFIFMFLMILFLGITGVLLGYFDAMQMNGVSLIIKMVLTLLASVLMVILGNAFQRRGLKIAAFLSDPSAASAYEAAGNSLGLMIASIITALVSFIYFNQSKRRFYKLARKDKSRNQEYVSALVVLVMKNAFYSVFPALILLGIFAMNQFQFVREFEKVLPEVVVTYQFSAYSGVFLSILSLPILMIVLMLFHANKDFSRSFSNLDHNEPKLALHRIMKTNLVITFFFSGLMLASSSILENGLFGLQSTLIENLVRISSIYLILITYGLTTIKALTYTKNMRHSAWIIPLVCLVLRFVLNLVFLRIKSLGIYGLVLGDLVVLLILCGFATFALVSSIRFEFDFADFILFPLIATAISAVLLFVVVLILNIPFKNIPLLTLTIGLIVGFLGYFVVLLMSRAIRAEELYNIPGGNILYLLAGILHLN